MLHSLPLLTIEEMTHLKKCVVCGEVIVGCRIVNGHPICSKHLDKDYRIEAYAKIKALQMPQGVLKSYEKHEEVEVVVLDTEFPNLLFFNTPVALVQYWTGDRDEEGEPVVDFIDARHADFDWLCHELRSILDGKVVVGHNLSSDGTVLHRFGIKPRAYFDTMGAAAILEGYGQPTHSKKDGRHGYSLEACIYRYAPRYSQIVNKEDREYFISMDKAPEKWNGEWPDKILNYAVIDVAGTLAVYEALCKKLLDRPELWPVLCLENEVLFTVIEMQAHGIPVNAKKWREMIARIEPKIEELRKTISTRFKKQHGHAEAKKIAQAKDARKHYYAQIKQLEMQFEAEWDALEVEAVFEKGKTGRKDGLTRCGYRDAQIKLWKEKHNMYLPHSYNAKVFNIKSRDHMMAGIRRNFYLTQPDGKKLSLKMPNMTKKTIAKYADEKRGWPAEIAAFFKSYQGLKELINLYDKYGPKFLDHCLFLNDTKTFTNLNSIGYVKSGRFSSSGFFNGQQVANAKKYKHWGVNIRDNFEAPEGYWLIGGDYAQQEVWIMAVASGDEQLLAQLHSLDVYSDVAILLFNLPVDAPRNAEGKLEYTLPGTHIDARSAAKIILLGIAYGKGPFSLAEEIGCSEEEAKAFLRLFEERYPKLFAKMRDAEAFGKKYFRAFSRMGRFRDLYMDYVMLKVALRKEVNKKIDFIDQKNTLTHAPEEFAEPKLYDDDSEDAENEDEDKDYISWMEDPYDPIERAAKGHIGRAARNMLAQAGAADLTKLAMWLFYKRVHELGLEHEIWLILTVHDEILAQATDTHADQARGMLSAAMTDAFYLLYPEAEVKPVGVWKSKTWIKD